MPTTYLSARDVMLGREWRHSRASYTERTRRDEPEQSVGSDAESYAEGLRGQDPRASPGGEGEARAVRGQSEGTARGCRNLSNQPAEDLQAEYRPEASDAEVNARVKRGARQRSD